MQKLERLLNLTAVLLHSGRPLSAAELRDRVPGYPEGDAAFHRAFERDKDDLREMGIPLDLVEIPGADPPLDGYRIPRDQYYLPDLGLEPDELTALQLAASAVQLDGVEGIEALWKLGGATGVGEVAPATASIPTDPRLAPLFDAVSRRATCRFTYRDEVREVHPYGIVFQRGHWYLRGFDVGRDDRRTYRVDRIQGDVTLGAAGAFEPPESDDDEVVAEGWRLAIDPPVRCRLLVDASHAAIALAHLGADADQVESRPDGAVVVELTVTNRSAFRGMVLTYLEHAEILEPPELRDDLVAWLRDVPGVAS
ncbi:helix-turn-helix transcriptional regulator [Actinomarinicola tropica]|uniref:WYL domain-containing protein n=1 Tax=Actinomarinicola tropica TaxID=2789776 RepID=A0A5Q2RK41_9ACTN|nr:WYL domain-containing protein [Actinomarinicola tropica]QGG95292.1 WYL domain-containing protein [Actinomarinicola tropica]